MISNFFTARRSKLTDFRISEEVESENHKKYLLRGSKDIFSSYRTKFIVKLPNLNYEYAANRNVKLNDLQKDILLKMEKGVEYTYSEISAIINRQASWTRSMLNDLVEKELLDTIGKTKGRKYTLK